MNQIRHTFKKGERLCSKKVLDQLFTNGKTFIVYPLKIVFYETELPIETPVQVLFSVGKKIFKKAVDRNLLKRRIRESYRINKFKLYEQLGNKQIALAIIYIGKKKEEYKMIEKSVEAAIAKIPPLIKK